MTVRMRHALQRDLEHVVDIWVDAFDGDPFLGWMAGDAPWPAFGTAWMTFIAELCFARGHTYLDDAGQVAVGWVPPDVPFAGADDVARGRRIIADHAGEERAAQALDPILAARAQALDEPHWTLQYLGVRAAHRGAGLGERSVSPILDVCDADGLPCALVSTNPRNVSFYERLGFRTVAEVPTSDGAATLRPMQRPASRS